MLGPMVFGSALAFGNQGEVGLIAAMCIIAGIIFFFVTLAKKPNIEVQYQIEES